MIIAPDINWPAGIEGYEPKTKDQLDQLSVPVSGTKTFEYAFTASKRGSYIIPAIDFSFFNVVAEKYITLHSEPLTVSVTQGTGKGSFTKNNSTLQPKPPGFLDGQLYTKCSFNFIFNFFSYSAM